jgi:predicted tellurium resistance membrane protein TerC
MLQQVFTGEGIASLLTLTLLEVVLGIDNIIFISILSSKLPEEAQGKARLIGLSLALIVRIGLLSIISILAHLHQPLLVVNGFEFSWRDLILLCGGFFLIYKTTVEIHEKLEGDEAVSEKSLKLSLASAIFQIVLLDIVFSFDSILTAIGLVNNIAIMVIALIISMIIMLVFSKMLSDFINKHPSIKMLAFSFLLMIGVLLIVEAMHVDIPRGYVYFAMAFSLFVEILNIYSDKNRRKPVKLHDTYVKKNNEEEKEKSPLN